ncbi:MAG: hypothetical protein ACREIP_11570, partial [Alphaproteobacteria bacterium]
MFKDKDPRAELFAAASKPIATGLVAEEQLALFYGTVPAETFTGSRTWYLRGHNFVLAYSETEPGASFSRLGQVDEYVLYLADAACGAIIEWNGERVEVPGGSIAFVPPGDSRITLPEGGNPVRLFTVASQDLVAAASNAHAYDTPRNHIPPFKSWPAPSNGWKVRSYSLSVPDEPGRFGRIFRCTTFMVNALPTQIGPRDPAKMSPHHHDDFEQCSLALKGSFSHHLRWPWTTDMGDWRGDKAVEVGAPSALVIPPPVIH